MITENRQDDQLTRSQEAANVRLAVFLGLVAFTVYLGFLLFNII